MRVPHPSAIPADVLLLAARLRGTPGGAQWPDATALAEASLAAASGQVAAAMAALHGNRALLGHWAWPDALELSVRFVAQWPALADSEAAAGALLGWVEAEPRLQTWVEADAWQAAGVDPELRDLLWGVQRAFVRIVSSASASVIAAAYQRLGLLVVDDGRQGTARRLVVGTDQRAMAVLASQPPRPLTAPQVPVVRPQPLPESSAPQALEQLAFDVGLKQVLRLDHVPVSAVPLLVARMESAGLWALPGWQRYGLLPNSKDLRLTGTRLDLTCVFVARRQADAQAAAQADATEKSPVPREQRDAATRTLGRLLGYPDCCTQAFLALADQGANDAWCSVVAHRSSSGPHPWYVNTWRDLAEVLPFFPCSWDCGAARAYGKALMAALAERDPVHHQRLCAQLCGVVLAWSRQDPHAAGSVLLRDCRLVRDAGELSEVHFGSTLHWSQLAGPANSPDLPRWLPAISAGGALLRGADGWRLRLGDADADRSPPGWSRDVLVLDFQAELPQSTGQQHAMVEQSACATSVSDAR